MALPGVSFLVPTCGRPPRHQALLEEVLESFARQDYAGPRELVLLNDCPGQRLRCAAPGVRVVNVPERFASLGEKFNYLVDLARYDVLLPQDDDDLSLPHRAAQAVAALAAGCDYFYPGVSWFLQHHGGRLALDLTTPASLTHNASAFRKAAWRAGGGVPAVSGPQDVAADALLRRHGRVSPPLDRGRLADVPYVYRWGVSDLHLSAQADTAAAYRAYGERAHTPGVYDLVPRWRHDYARMCREFRGRKADCAADNAGVTL